MGQSGNGMAEGGARARQVARDHHKESARVAYLALTLWVLLAPARAAAADVDTPFPTANRNPLVAPFGLPDAAPARLLAPGARRVRAAVDVSNVFTVVNNPRESLTLDGETTRLALRAQTRTASAQWSITVPLWAEGGGVLDRPIEAWHHVWGFPDGGRPSAPAGRLRYHYERDGVTLLDVDRSHAGLGDVQLGVAIAGVQGPTAARSLRLDLTLPTGHSGALFGSGAFGLALSGQASATHRWGRSTWGSFAGAGVLALTRGKVLAAQQRRLVAFGYAGLGYAPRGDWALKAQLQAHSAFYRDSALAPLGPGAQVVVGGGFRVGRQVFDLALSEDALVDSAPDVSFTLAWRRAF